jgi:hypothetical protein
MKEKTTQEEFQKKIHFPAIFFLFSPFEKLQKTEDRLYFLTFIQE